MFAIHSFESLLFFSAFLVLFYGPWRATCTDAARSAVFAERDRLFDIANEGRLRFDSEEYQIIRESLNRHIRFAHSLTWLRLALFSALLPKNYSSGAKNVDGAIGSIEDDFTRKEVSDLVERSNRTMFLMIISKSLILSVCFVIAYLVARLKTSGKRPWDDMTQKLTPILYREAEAYCS